MTSREGPHTTINTDGQPGLPFQGETMVCGICREIQKSDPQIESQWDRIQTGGLHIYYCPNHKIDAKVAHFETMLKLLLRRTQEKP